MALRVIAAFLALFIALGAARADTAYTVDTVLGEWKDQARDDRVVPYKIYYAANAQGAQPIVIFSHGLGGSRDGAEYLLRFLAEHGYVAVAVQHKGSDTPAVMQDLQRSSGSIDAGTRTGLGGRLRDSISPHTAADRFRDIPFAIDQLTLMNGNDAKLKGRLDVSRIGMSGHSFGAITVMAVSGQTFPLGGAQFTEERIKASIAYSPSKPRAGDPAAAFATIHIPVFHMTGTEDGNPLDSSEPASNRQIPYQVMSGTDKYLVVFAGGDHMIFSGRRIEGGPRPKDDMFHGLIQKASLAYWDYYLRGSAEAKAYLTGGGFQRDLGANGTFEFQAK